MIPILSSAQARAFDRFLAERCAVPSLLLMENAGRGAAHVVHERLQAAGGNAAGPRRVLCVCGVGNNGGDGFVVARHLLCLGHQVTVALLGRPEQVAGDAAVNLQAWRGLGGTLIELEGEGNVRARVGELAANADAIVDALLGTGLSREVSGRFRDAVKSINASRRPVFALDVPSGMDADTGAALGVCVRAQVTITFGHPKSGLLSSTGADEAGELVLQDLGVPRERGPASEPRGRWLELSDVRGWLTPRTPSAHKGRSGRLLVVAGSPGKTGAALLSAQAALRAGAGLVTICTSAEAARSLDQRVVEVMTEALDAEKPLDTLERALEGVMAVVIGPGLGLSATARSIVNHVVLKWRGPKLIDADAISLFAGRAHELQKAAGPCLLTPHPGELARLLGVSAVDVERDRFGSFERALASTGQALLLKGPHTLVGEPGSAPWVVSQGHPALATGGAGDVLSGICGAFLAALNAAAPAVARPGAAEAPASPSPRVRAGLLGAVVHGHAARRWVDAHGSDRGLLAREISDHVPAAIGALLDAMSRAS